MATSKATTRHSVSISFTPEFLNGTIGRGTLRVTMTGDDETGRRLGLVAWPLLYYWAERLRQTPRRWRSLDVRADFESTTAHALATEWHRRRDVVPMGDTPPIEASVRISR